MPGPGHGTFSLAVPNLPPFSHPDGAEFGWAIAIGLAAVVVGGAIRWLALYLKPHVERRIALWRPVVGLGGGGLAIAYAEGSGRPSSEVLFSGQDALPSLLENSATYSVEALLLLIACKGLAYGASLSAFRGGPVFPGMFVGAAGGVALSHLPGLPMVAGAAMGIGAMTCAMLGLPLTSVLLITPLSGLGRGDRHAPDHRGRGRRLRRPGLFLTPAPCCARPGTRRRTAGGPRGRVLLVSDVRGRTPRRAPL